MSETIPTGGGRGREPAPPPADESPRDEIGRWEPIPPACTPDPLTGRCATCADEGVEGRVLAVHEGEMAEVEMEGGVREVAVDLLDAVAVGDRVLVHAGVAIAWLGSADG